MKAVAQILAGLIALSLLTSCDGDGDGDGDGTNPELTNSETNSPQQPNEDLPSGSGINGGLTGRIVTNYHDILTGFDLLAQYDLSTGEYTELPLDTVQDWLASNGQSESDFYDTRESYFGATSTSPIQYVQTVPTCFRDENDPSIWDSCVAIFSEDLQRQSMIRIVNYELNWPAKLSPSGKYLAIHEYISFASTKSSIFALYDVAELKQVDRYVVDLGPESSQRRREAAESPIVWTPDGALVYTVPSDNRVVVYITEPGSLDVARTIKLPATYQGEATSLDVSPDGTKLLIGYEPDYIIGEFNRNGVLMLDLETLKISVPAVAEADPTTVPLGDNIQGNVRAPVWSPDGQWILVLEGTDILASPSANLAVSARLFAVPATQSRTLLTADSPTSAIPIRLEHPTRGTLDYDWNAGSWRYDATFDWVE